MSYSMVSRNTSIDGGKTWTRDPKMTLTDWDSMVEDLQEDHGSMATLYGDDRLYVDMGKGRQTRYDRNDDKD